jgi:hypothetical protein
MSEEKRATSGFKIKWADREIEYYGDSVPEVFKTVFDHVKSVPITYAQQAQPSAQEPMRPPSTLIAETRTPAAVEGDEYERIAKDAEVTKDQVLGAIKFEKRDKFPTLVPYLPKHPDLRDAVVLVSYAVQVGLQKTPIEVSYLKVLLKGPNGYPMPGNELGLILMDFREGDVIIASQTQRRNKPFTLSTKGIDRARKLLKA